MPKSKKIFIGLCDIASTISQWENGFNELGLGTLKGSLTYQHPMQNSNLDFVIQETKDTLNKFNPFSSNQSIKSWLNNKVESHYFKKAFKECDIFLFIWTSFKYDMWDYKYLKKHGKKIVTVFAGDDVRWYYAMKQEYELYNIPPVDYVNYDYSVKSLEDKLRYLRMSEKYSDIILSQPNQSHLALRPYHNLFIPMVTKDLGYKPEQRRAPVIIHAPTSPMKGTKKYIMPEIEKLKNEGINFEFKLIQNIPHAQALQEYLNADIIIDSLGGNPGMGSLANECLAMGKIVILTMGKLYNYDQKIPDDCPMIDVKRDNLYPILKALILDYNKRIEIAKKGREYVEKYHNPAKLANNILETLSKPEEERIPDFYPSFFRENFIPESEESIPVYNKWTNIVKDCDWYKSHVKPGERAGLVF